jgi:SAM-dependent methyltransferase
MLNQIDCCDIDQAGCVGCGGREFRQNLVISDELASAWELTEAQRFAFDEREGHYCVQCQMSKRVRMLLWTLRKLYQPDGSLRILHLNQVNHLGPLLRQFGQVVETIYRPDVERGALLEGFRNEDICRLTLGEAEFDVAVHSETLEHVFDFAGALEQVHRVLKPGGYQVYTVPLLHDRGTRQRMRLEEDGKITTLLPPSYHGNEGEFPVVWEFGYDFLRQRSTEAEIYYDNYDQNPAVFAIAERKPG